MRARPGGRQSPGGQSRDVKLAQGLHHGSLDGSLNLGLDLFRELRSQKGQLRCDTRSRVGGLADSATVEVIVIKLMHSLSQGRRAGGTVRGDCKGTEAESSMGIQARAELIAAHLACSLIDAVLDTASDLACRVKHGHPAPKPKGAEPKPKSGKITICTWEQWHPERNSVLKAGTRRLVGAAISDHSMTVVPTEVDHWRARAILTIDVGGHVNV